MCNILCRNTNGFILSERKRFVLYMFFVWGITSLLIIIAIGLNSVNTIPDRWRIGIGEQTCFLKTGDSECFYNFIRNTIGIIILYDSYIFFRWKFVQASLLLFATLYNMGDKCDIFLVDCTTDYKSSA